jgi:Permeases of the drug/metabolite transporter (DMT) superfamily
MTDTPSPAPLPHHMPLRRHICFLLAAFCCLLWSGAYVTGKLAIGTEETAGFGPFRASFFRFGICGMCLGLWGVWRDPQSLRVRPEDWPTFLRLALLGMCLTYVFNYRGLALSTGTAAALIMATEPVWIAALAVIFLRERMTQARLFGILAGLAGAVMVVLSSQQQQQQTPAAGAAPETAAGLAMLGNALMVFSLLWESAAVLTVKRLTARYKGRAILTYEFLLGSLMLAPFAAYEALREGPIAPAPAAWGSFLYLVVGCTLVAYTVWYRLVEDVDASELTVFIFLQPVTGTLLGVAVEGTKLSLATVAGAVLVLAGVWGITRNSATATATAIATGDGGGGRGQSGEI